MRCDNDMVAVYLRKQFFMKPDKTTFFFLRLPIAISFLGHGLVRLPKLAAFSEGMVAGMEKSILPSGLVLVWGYVLPIVEALLGVALLAGIKPRLTLYACLSVMAILILGSSSVENWGAIEAQLVHAIYLAGLLLYVEKTTVPAA